MNRKHEAEFRRAKRTFQACLSQLLEEEWQRWAPTNWPGEWSEEAEQAMIAAIETRHSPMRHRNTGPIIDVTEAAVNGACALVVKT